MGQCVFCGKHAGGFAVAHRRCREQRAAAVERMTTLFEPFLSGSFRVEIFASMLNESADANLIQRHEIPELVPQWTGMALADIARRRPISPQERARAWVLMAHYAMTSKQDAPEWVKLWGHLDLVSPMPAKRPKSAARA